MMKVQDGYGWMCTATETGIRFTSDRNWSDPDMRDEKRELEGYTISKVFQDDGDLMILAKYDLQREYRLVRVRFDGSGPVISSISLDPVNYKNIQVHAGTRAEGKGGEHHEEWN